MKKIISLMLVVIIVFSITGCVETEESLNEDIKQLKSEISDLEKQKETLEKEVVETKVEKGVAKYVVTINIKQEHAFWDFENNIKDEMNDISIQIPVDKEYYDSLEIGDVIDDSFRMGSFVMKGSFGKWNVTVEDKEIM